MVDVTADGNAGPDDDAAFDPLAYDELLEGMVGPICRRIDRSDTRKQIDRQT